MNLNHNITENNLNDINQLQLDISSKSSSAIIQKICDYYNIHSPVGLTKGGKQASELSKELLNCCQGDLKKLCDELIISSDCAEAIGAVLQTGLDDETVQSLQVNLQWHLHPSSNSITTTLALLSGLLSPELFSDLLKTYLQGPNAPFISAVSDYILKSIDSRAASSDGHHLDPTQRNRLHKHNQTLLETIVPFLSDEVIREALSPQSVFRTLSDYQTENLLSLICASASDQQWDEVIMPILHNSNYAPYLGYMPLNERAHPRIEAFITYHLDPEREVLPLNNLSRMTRKMHRKATTEGTDTRWIEERWQQICVEARNAYGSGVLFWLSKENRKDEIDSCYWQVEGFVRILTPKQITKQFSKSDRDVSEEFRAMFFIAAAQHPEIDLVGLLDVAYPIDESGLLHKEYSPVRLMEMLRVLVQLYEAKAAAVKNLSEADLEILFTKCAARLKLDDFLYETVTNPYEYNCVQDPIPFRSRAIANQKLIKAATKEQKNAVKAIWHAGFHEVINGTEESQMKMADLNQWILLKNLWKK